MSLLFKILAIIITIFPPLLPCFLPGWRIISNTYYNLTWRKARALRICHASQINFNSGTFFARFHCLFIFSEHNWVA